MRFFILLFCALHFSSILAHSYDTDENPKVFFIKPLNGDTVSNPINVRFGAKGINIVPAGVDLPMSGHHHLLINVDKIPNLKMPIPADNNHLHFGKGQSEVELNLPKGKHTLQLLIGNHLHIPHSKPIISEKIEISVE
tara:strand:- start:3618 stop:4031 length:414 start_codon:yes stop_codon:yes gene_type:complete